MNTIENKIDKFKTQALGIVTVMTVVNYIIFSFIKRFVSNELYFFIPLVLFISNLLIILELIFTNKSSDSDSIDIRKKNKKKLLVQLVINIGFVGLVTSYLIK